MEQSEAINTSTGKNVNLQLALFGPDSAVLAHRHPVVREARLVAKDEVIQADLKAE
jgi:hypothetical protein